MEGTLPVWWSNGKDNLEDITTTDFLDETNNHESDSNLEIDTVAVQNVQRIDDESNTMAEKPKTKIDLSKKYNYTHNCYECGKSFFYKARTTKLDGPHSEGTCQI